MVSKSAVHALNVLVCLAGLPAGATASTLSMARTMGVSVSCLEVIIKQLRDQGLIRSFRGPGGGYQINHDPDELTVWDVVSLFLAPSGQREAAAPQRTLTAELEAQIEQTRNDFLKSHTISQLIAPQGAADPSSGRVSSPPRFQPLPVPWRPNAPNSVFDLSAFYQLAAA
ncbi:MAG: HTH-type transcriptional regulator CymR [Pseudomonadota bacterium]|jgi:Rrf2 family iron-sulfur cluster assembly transcriptional regulator